MADHELLPHSTYEQDEAAARLADMGVMTVGDARSQVSVDRTPGARSSSPQGVVHEVIRSIESSDPSPNDGQLDLYSADSKLSPLPHEREEFRKWLAELADKDARRRAEKLGIDANVVLRARGLPIPEDESNHQAS